MDNTREKLMRFVGGDVTPVIDNCVTVCKDHEDQTVERSAERRMTMPKYPCRGCVYYKVCGENTRTAPCYGRMTKRDK